MQTGRLETTLIALGYGVNCLIWSSTWMAIKVGLRGAPPMTGVAVRFVIAAVLIGAVIAVRRLRVPWDRRYVAIGVFLGTVHLAVPYVLVYWGEQHISSGLTAILYATMPFMVALLARAVIGDRLSAPKLIGIGAAIAGVWTIFSGGASVIGEHGLLGMAAILVSVFFAALASVVIKKYSGGYHPIVSLLLPFIVGATLVSAVAAPLEQSNPFRFDATTWASIIYLAIAGSFVAFAIFFWLIKRVDVTIVSYQTFIIPILAVVWGAVFLDERITARAAMGAGFILVGILVATGGDHLARKHGLRKRAREGTAAGG